MTAHFIVFMLLLVTPQLLMMLIIKRNLYSVSSPSLRLILTLIITLKYESGSLFFFFGLAVHVVHVMRLSAAATLPRCFKLLVTQIISWVAGTKTGTKGHYLHYGRKLFIYLGGQHGTGDGLMRPHPSFKLQGFMEYSKDVNCSSFHFK